MRLFVLALVFVFVFLPALLILFARERGLSRPARIGWAMAAFLAPVAVFVTVQLMPELANNAVEARQWGRMLGLGLTASGFILPWVIFSLFLHRTRA